MEKIRGILLRHLVKPDEETGKLFSVVRYETPNGLKDGKISIVAPDLSLGDYFEAEGTWQTRKFAGKPDDVFQGKSARPDLPTTKAQAAQWFAAIFSRETHGVTTDSIKAFVDKHGDKVAKLCGDDPELILGITTNQNQYRPALVRDWSRRVSGHRAMFLLEKSGVDQKAIAAALDAYRDNAFEVINSNPYALARMPKFGFKNADMVGNQMGIKAVDQRRIEAALLEAIETERRAGHTYASLNTVGEKLAKSFSIDLASVSAFAQKQMSNPSAPFAILDRNGRLVAMSRELYAAESSIAKRCMHLLANGRRHEKEKVARAVDQLMQREDFKQLDSIQRAAVEMAASEPVSILTGGPGTGKSRVTEAIAAIAQTFDQGKIILCAPTGKAATRLEEAAKLPAVTIHELLQATEDKRSGGSMFGRNKNKPLPPGSFVVVDEASMVDAVTMAALLDAMPSDGRLLLVGDKHQLPSVDAGNVLADMLMATAENGEFIIPRTELINVYRQGTDSRIATGAAEIKNGNVPAMTNKHYKGLTFYEHVGQDIVDRVKWVVQEVLLKQLAYKPHHISVLVPQAPGTAGGWQLNSELSKIMNPNGKPIPGAVARQWDSPAMPIPRIGDRVMLTKTNKENKDNKVVNGDVGVIVDAYEKPVAKGTRPYMKVKFDNGKMLEYPTSLWHHFILAYAITIHKSQGSQYPAVIMPITSAHQNMLDRQLFYTGWTRAKSMLFVVGEREAVQAAVDNTEKSKRNTRLVEFLLAASNTIGFVPANSNKPTVKLPEPLKPIPPVFKPVDFSGFGVYEEEPDEADEETLEEEMEMNTASLGGFI